MNTILTRRNTGIVIDSTCDPWSSFKDDPNIRMVPLKVLVGDEAYDDLLEITIDQLYEKMAGAASLPTTSQPTVEQFTVAYAEMCERFEHVLSIHISAEMSGTVRAATEAGERFPRVEIIDSRTVSGGAGLLIARILSLLTTGIGTDDLQAYVAHYKRRGRFLIHTPSLEHLRRGGRIGRAQSMVGGLLGIHPLIELQDGLVTAYGKARGERRALDMMLQYVADNAGLTERLFVGLLHGANPDALPVLKQRILALRPDAQIVLEGSVGCVVGVHIGPGPAAIAMIAE